MPTLPKISDTLIFLFGLEIKPLDDEVCDGLKRLIWIYTVLFGLSVWMFRSVLAAAATFVVCRCTFERSAVAQW